MDSFKNELGNLKAALENMDARAISILPMYEGFVTYNADLFFYQHFRAAYKVLHSRPNGQEHR